MQPERSQEHGGQRLLLLLRDQVARPSRRKGVGGIRPARALPRILVALGCVLTFPVSVAAQPPPLVTWKGCSDLGCMGQVTMRVARAARENAAGTYNFSVFTNH